MSSTSLPKGWRIVKFGDVVSNLNESTRNPATLGLERVVGLDHMDAESLPLVRWDNLSDMHEGTSFTRVFRAGHVLFGKRRAYQRKVSVPDFDGICSSDILVFQPVSSDLLPKFLPYIVQSDRFFDHALGTSAGSLSPRTKWQELAEYEFALPPLAEQQKIVDVISAFDETLECYRTLPIDIQHQSMLQELLNAGGDGWVVTTLGDVAEINPEQTKGFDDEKEIIYIDLSSVSANTGISTGLETIRFGDAPGRARRVIREGDVIVSTVRPYLRGFALVPPYLDGEVASTGFAVVRAKEGNTISGFVWALVGMASFVDHLMSLATGSNYPAVRPDDVAGFPILLPPLVEQRRIVKIVSSLDRVRESVHEAITNLRQTRNKVLNDLFTQGFKHV